ncbi:MAG: glycosyltransferase family 2 protein, partial [Actinomycetota bacterium]|nr:glycosyltransferase family 2 protein [Actinomycetota bacterium]
MPESVPSPAPSASHESVAAMLVSHDGARWLPAVIDGIRAQTAPLDRVVVVDTTSRDESAELLAAAFGEPLSAPGSTSFPAAVRLGLGRLDALPDPPEWVWLLHDDTNPDPGALAALLAAAAEHPEADVLGPKLREWPSLRRLLEVGVTISGTGRRELGLERGEYDQGQHDDVRPVLAVNTAGMLVRRRVLEELGGFDEQLPIFGNDVDFGWRVAAAGHTTLVVPNAVVFHAEAAHTGVRRTPLTGRHTHFQERRAALYTLLANSSGRYLPFQLVRLAMGTLLRMLGFFLVRSPGEAFDELAALVSICSKPGQIRAARRERRRTRSTDPAVAERVRELLAPTWLPYRHGLDVLGDLLSALTDQAADVAERRRAAAAELDPSSMAARRAPTDTSDLTDPDREEDFEDTGAVARFVTNPVAVALAVFVVAALILALPAYGAVTGAGLSPVPESVGNWWRLHLESWHQLGVGTDVPAPAYLLPLALVGSVLGATLTVSALLMLAVPLALWGAWRFLRVAGRLITPFGAPRWLLLIGATAYSLVPVVSGAWGAGRLGMVVVAVLLPWFAHAALGFADPDPDRRWRAAWRCAVLLTLTTAFAPVTWMFALLLGLVVVVAAGVVVPGATRDRAVWGPPAAAVGAVPVLLLPWWLPALLTGAGEGLLLDIGRLPAARIDDLGMLTGRIAGDGAPAWVGWLLLVLAVLALVPRLSRIPVLVCWIVAAVAAVVAATVGRVSVSLAAVDAPVGLGVLLVVLQGAIVVAVVLGILGAVRGGSPRWSVVAAAVLAAVVPVAGLVWFGIGQDDPLDGDDSDIPAYMVQRSMTAPERGILVVRGNTEEGLTYSIRRDDGITLGEDEIVALSPEDRELTSVVRELASRPNPDAVTALAGFGVEYVVLPAPADATV